MRGFFFPRLNFRNPEKLKGVKEQFLKGKRSKILPKEKNIFYPQTQKNLPKVPSNPPVW